MKEWLKQHWKVIAAVGAGAIGLYLLWQRSQGAVAAPAAATDNGLPSTGAAPVDTSGAPPQYLNGGEQAAADYAAQAGAQTTQQLFGATENTPGGPIPTSNIPIANQIPGATLTGVVKEKWAQAVYQGQIIWEDKSGQGRNALTDVQAQQPALENTGYGPYAHGKPNTLNAINKVVQFVTHVVAATGGAPSSSGALDTSYVNQSPVPTPQENASLGAFYPTPTGAPVATVQHVPGPTTPAGIPNHAVGAH